MPAENIRNSDPTSAVIKSNITMNPNPAYGTTTAVKMDINPAYGTTTAIKMENNPAYASTIH